MPKPEATSTPKLVTVTGRKNIKDHEHEDSARSPIGNFANASPKVSPYKLRSRANDNKSSRQENAGSANRSYSKSPHRSPSRHRSASNSEETSDEEPGFDSEPSNLTPEYVDSFQKSQERKQTSYFTIGMFLTILFAGLILIKCLGPGADITQGSNLNLTKQINSAHEKFSKQDKDFWIHIKSNLNEIPLLKQPRTIMFLYGKNSENTLNKILSIISEISVCHLRNCGNKPVAIDGATLGQSEFIKDYGKIISQYEKPLTENGVMLIKNLEKVPGRAAQAFHTLCDDYHPVVQNALIIFTVKVDVMPDKVHQLRYLESLFLKLWGDISADDKFYPLFTRITGTVLAVKPE